MAEENKRQHFRNLCAESNVKPKIGFVGGGNMARALISGFLAADIVSVEDVVVSDPDSNARNLLNGMHVKATDSTSTLVEAAKGAIIILAVKPSSVAEFYQSLNELAESTTPGLFMSICAGISLENLETNLHNVWPNLAVVRVMPNTPALIGCSASAFSAGRFTSAGHAAITKTLLETVGTCHRVDEKMMDAVTGLSGSGPAYVYTIIDAMSDGGVKMGLPRDLATSLAVQTILGSAQMMLKSGKHPGEMKNMVCSPGGTTIAGVHVLEQAGVRAAFISAIQAATERSKELGKEG